MFEQHGYSITYAILKATEQFVPQKRTRVYYLALNRNKFNLDVEAADTSLRSMVTCITTMSDENEQLDLNSFMLPDDHFIVKQELEHLQTIRSGCKTKEEPDWPKRHAAMRDNLRMTYSKSTVPPECPDPRRPPCVSAVCKHRSLRVACQNHPSSHEPGVMNRPANPDCHLE